MKKLLNYGGQNIFKDSYDENDYNRICSRNKSLKHIISLILMMVLTFMFALFGAITSEKRSTLFIVRLPYVEKHLDLELILLLIVQTFLSFCCLCETIGSQVSYNLYINVITTKTELIKFDIEMFSSDLKARILTTYQMKQKLYLIFDRIQNINRYYIPLKSNFS